MLQQMPAKPRTVLTSIENREQEQAKPSQGIPTALSELLTQQLKAETQKHAEYEAKTALLQEVVELQLQQQEQEERDRAEAEARATQLEEQVVLLTQQLEAATGKHTDNEANKATLGFLREMWKSARATNTILVAEVKRLKAAAAAAATAAAAAAQAAASNPAAAETAAAAAAAAATTAAAAAQAAASNPAAAEKAAAATAAKELAASDAKAVQAAAAAAANIELLIAAANKVRADAKGFMYKVAEPADLSTTGKTEAPEPPSGAFGEPPRPPQFGAHDEGGEIVRGKDEADNHRSGQDATEVQPETKAARAQARAVKSKGAVNRALDKPGRKRSNVPSDQGTPAAPGASTASTPPRWRSKGQAMLDGLITSRTIGKVSAHTSVASTIDARTQNPDAARIAQRARAEVRRRLAAQPSVQRKTTAQFDDIRARQAVRHRLRGAPDVVVANALKATCMLDEYMWYQPTRGKSEVARLLKGTARGTFCVRKSTSQQGCFALAVSVSPKAAKPWWGLITPTGCQYKLQFLRSYKNCFDTVPDLIRYYRANPCALINYHGKREFELRLVDGAV